MRLLRVSPSGLSGAEIPVPAAFATAHESEYDCFIVEFSVDPGQALKSPQIIRCSENPRAYVVSSPISSRRYDVEFASRCVEKKLIVRPLTVIAACNTARPWLN